MECVPRQLAEKLSKNVSIPVIGIGAGVNVDAQVVVFHDILGCGVERSPKFVKNYTMLNDVILESIKAYNVEVKNGIFPEDKHTYSLKDVDLQGLYGKNK